MILYKQEVQFLKTCSQSESLEETNHDFTIHIHMVYKCILMSKDFYELRIKNKINLKFYF